MEGKQRALRAFRLSCW